MEASAVVARRLRAVLAAGGATALVTLVAAPGAGAATVCPDADAAPATVGVERSLAAMACLVDHERTARGLSPVAVSAPVAQAARWHADDMAARNYFAHDAPLGAPHGTSVGDRVTAAGYTWSTVGENIARGQRTPRAVMAGWLGSAGHCANIVRPTFTDAGYGLSLNGNGPYWVQAFARPMGVPAPIGPAVACPTTPAEPQPAGVAPAPAPAPATGTAAGAAPGATAPGAAPAATSTRPKAVATRSRRRLTVRVTVPAGARRVAIVVRVAQGGRTVRTRRMTRAAGRTHRMTLTLPAARAGRVSAKVGARTVTARFR